MTRPGHADPAVAIGLVVDRHRDARVAREVRGPASADLAVEDDHVAVEPIPDDGLPRPAVGIDRRDGREAGRREEGAHVFGKRCAGRGRRELGVVGLVGFAMTPMVRGRVGIVPGRPASGDRSVAGANPASAGPSRAGKGVTRRHPCDPPGRLQPQLLHAPRRAPAPPPAVPAGSPARDPRRAPVTVARSERRSMPSASTRAPIRCPNDTNASTSACLASSRATRRRCRDRS